MTNYTKRSNAQRAARSALKNDKAQEGVDFTTTDDGEGNWSIEYPAPKAAEPTIADIEGTGEVNEGQSDMDDDGDEASAPTKPTKPTTADDGDVTLADLQREAEAGGNIGDILLRAYQLGSGSRARTRRSTSKREGPTKREQAAELLRRDSGATRAEILELTGWPAVSIQALAKASGLKLRQVKDGRVTTYFGEAA